MHIPQLSFVFICSQNPQECFIAARPHSVGLGYSLLIPDNPKCPSSGDPHRDVTLYPPCNDNANAPFYPTPAHAALTAGTVRRPRPTSDTMICHQSHCRHENLIPITEWCRFRLVAPSLPPDRVLSVRAARAVKYLRLQFFYTEARAWSELDIRDRPYFSALATTPSYRREIVGSGSSASGHRLRTLSENRLVRAFRGVSRPGSPIASLARIDGAISRPLPVMLLLPSPPSPPFLLPLPKLVGVRQRYAGSYLAACRVSFRPPEH